VDLKEGIWMVRTEYSVLKEKMKENECGWSKARICATVHAHALTNQNNTVECSFSVTNKPLVASLYKPSQHGSKSEARRKQRSQLHYCTEQIKLSWPPP
jgi:hypothetical protein